jgi:hypothetical protein
MTSILESDYTPQNRPYSQDELRDNRENLYKSLNLGSIKVWHSNCKHFYYVKQNGKKEKDILSSKNNDSGNCSVCWKINKCNNKHRAINIVNQYSNTFYDEPTYMTYNLADLEMIFYKWLYSDQQHKNILQINK